MHASALSSLIRCAYDYRYERRYKYHNEKNEIVCSFGETTGPAVHERMILTLFRSARHFSPIWRISPDLVVFSRLGESLLFKMNIFSYFCRKTGSGGLNFRHKNVK